MHEDASWLIELFQQGLLRAATRGELSGIVASEAQVRHDHKTLKGLAALATIQIVPRHVIGQGVTPPSEELIDLVATKDRLWFGRYRTLNSEYVNGRRYEPFGPGDFPQRFEALAQDLEAAERALDEAAATIGGTR